MKALIKAKNIVLEITFNFWLGETLFFWARDGFHWKAATTEEYFCDNIVSMGFVIYWAIVLRILIISIRQASNK